MCGIVGIHSLDGAQPIDAAVLHEMNDSILHRGPDSFGAYIDPGRVGLAMRRLSIIDVSGGDQPIGNEDGSVQVVYNGEIYNFRALRDELEAKGHRFETRSDTEVIVHAYEEFGDDCVTRFQGMFTFALWDSGRARLLLARDRIGIKQLFFTVAAGQLLWGSEIKALLQHPAVGRRIRPAAVNHYLTYLYVPEPLTMFEGIEELRAGHVLVAERGRIDVRPYWQLRYDVDHGMSADEAVHGLREHLEDAVRDCLVSDVPIGAFLSGGIDSGAVVALMAKYSPGHVNTFSIGYRTGGEAFDERRYAREVAERYATNHREFEMSPDIKAVAPQLVRAFDQPNADSTAVPTWYLCELTRRHVTVALSGLGGDELAAGYERHRGALVAERLRWIPSWLPRVLLRPLVDRIPDPKSGDPWGQRIKRFVHALDLPFDERYYHLIAQTTRATREALLTPEFAEQIDLDEPRTHFQSVARPGAGGPFAESGAVRRPQAVPARRSAHALRPRVDGALARGARAIPRPSPAGVRGADPRTPEAAPARTQAPAQARRARPPARELLPPPQDGLLRAARGVVPRRAARLGRGRAGAAARSKPAACSATRQCAGSSTITTRGARTTTT